jgi:hypothetical protein
MHRTCSSRVWLLPELTFKASFRSDCYLTITAAPSTSPSTAPFATTDTTTTATATMQSDTINQQFSKEYNSISDIYYASTENDVLSLKGCANTVPQSAGRTRDSTLLSPQNTPPPRIHGG